MFKFLSFGTIKGSSFRALRSEIRNPGSDLKPLRTKNLACLNITDHQVLLGVEKRKTMIAETKDSSSAKKMCKLFFRRRCKSLAFALFIAI
jgi:hypothetical protein